MCYKQIKADVFARVRKMQQTRRKKKSPKRKAGNQAQGQGKTKRKTILSPVYFMMCTRSCMCHWHLICCLCFGGLETDQAKAWRTKGQWCWIGRSVSSVGPCMNMQSNNLHRYICTLNLPRKRMPPYGTPYDYTRLSYVPYATHDYRMAIR